MSGTYINVYVSILAQFQYQRHVYQQLARCKKMLTWRL